MKLISQTHDINTVAARWRRQYPEGSVHTTSGDPELVYQQLLKLDHATATAADVAKIIGNDSWCGPKSCHECGTKVLATVELGQSDSCEDPLQFCASCLTHALRLLK